VLLFHADLPGLPGGFIGVDVFFVLSGFLITGLLIRERERTGRIDLRAFYARRARRILPAALVVIVFTVVAASVLLDPLDLIRVAGDGVAAALSVGNIRFAAAAMDYFSAGATPSPLLHYWSLGVEEQFYLLWPALLILAARGPRPRLSAGIVLLAVVVVSFAGGVAVTGISAPWAFYSLPTRAWQLAVGGMIALAAGPIARVPVPARSLAAWGGLAMVLAAAVILDPGTPYPGSAALLPTIGAGLLVLGGDGRWSPGALLVRAPMRFLGRISFSLYLVHWPILVLPAASLAVGDELPLPVRLGLAAISVPVAAACYWLVERPFHRGRQFAIHSGRVLALAGVTIAVTVIFTSSIAAATQQNLNSYSGVADGGSLASAAPTLTADGGLAAASAAPVFVYPSELPSAGPSTAAGSEPSQGLTTTTSTGSGAGTLATGGTATQPGSPNGSPNGTGTSGTGPAGIQAPGTPTAGAPATTRPGAQPGTAPGSTGPESSAEPTAGNAGSTAPTPSAGTASGGQSSTSSGEATTGPSPDGTQQAASPKPTPGATQPPTGAPATPRPTRTTAPRPTAPPTAPATTPPATIGWHLVTAPGVPAPSGPQPLPANVRPALSNAAGDWEALEADGCTAGYLQTVPANCVFGDPNGTVTVALVGDSHAAQWFPALLPIANARHWRLVTFTKLSCRFLDLPSYSVDLKREYTECPIWRALVVQRLQALKPTLTIIAAAGGMGTINEADNDPAVQGEAMARLIRQLPGQIAIMVDTPGSNFIVPSCISAHLTDVRACDTPRAAALSWRHLTLERTAAQETGATVIDMTNQICPGDPCPVVLNGMIVYRDGWHMTATFAASLAPALWAALPRLPLGAIEPDWTIADNPNPPAVVAMGPMVRL